MKRMTGIRLFGLAGALLLVGSTLQAQPPAPTTAAPAAPSSSAFIPVYVADSEIKLVQDVPEGRATLEAAQTGTGSGGGEGVADGYGPTPLPRVNILNKWLYGDNADKAKIKFAGWIDVDYTYRSTGNGINNIAPVMNRFGNEALARQIGLFIYKPLDPKEWSWGFNVIFMGGADASFLTPTAGGWQNTNPRFGGEWNDLNLTAHLPILTEGGIDIKAGRQTTVLGPMGALSWQRPLNSSDYAWFILEEGRFTGVSADWKITKRLSWYNAIEIGGWGVFFDDAAHGVDYLTQLVYWLDEKAEKVKVWTTVLTGPTGFHGPGNTTVWELGALINWSKQLYQIIDTQDLYSKQPLFFFQPPSYQQRSYDVYNYLGYRITKTVDITHRIEWFKDVDGGFYPGGFGGGGGPPHTDYFETTLGLDYHPTKWLQIRPEIRYDHATKDAFGELNNKRDQISISGDVMIKF
jgi:hypothetical protein